MNSPWMYSCGTVGQLEKSLTAWRTSSSSSTLTVTMFFTPQAFRTCTVRPEKPHCGNWAVPFMKSTTGCSSTVFWMNSLASICNPSEQSAGNPSPVRAWSLGRG